MYRTHYEFSACTDSPHDIVTEMQQGDPASYELFRLLSTKWDPELVNSGLVTAVSPAAVLQKQQLEEPIKQLRRLKTLQVALVCSCTCHPPRDALHSTTCFRLQLLLVDHAVVQIEGCCLALQVPAGPPDRPTHLHTATCSRSVNGTALNAGAAQLLTNIMTYCCCCQHPQALARSTQQDTYAAQAQQLAADLRPQLESMHGTCGRATSLCAWATEILAAFPHLSSSMCNKQLPTPALGWW